MTEFGTVVDAGTGETEAGTEQTGIDNESATGMRPGGRGGLILPPFNAERARQASLKRWEMYRRTSERAMVVGALGPEADNKSLTSRLASWAEIVAKQAWQATHVDDFGRYSTQSARFVREAIGADIGAPSSRGDNTIAAGQSSITIAGPVADVLLGRLAEMLAQRREP